MIIPIHGLPKQIRNKKKHIYGNTEHVQASLAWDKYENYLKEYCSALWIAKDKYFSSDLPEVLKSNLTKFWKLVNPSNKCSNILLLDKNSMPIPDSQCPTAFNSFFASVFTREDSSNVPFVPDFDFQCMAPITITLEGIVHLINNLKVSSSSGIDGINSNILKNTVSVPSNILFHIFKQSLTTGMLPRDGKVAKVVAL